MKKIFQILCLFSLVFLWNCDSEFLEEVHPTQQSADDFFKNDGEAKEAVIGMYDYIRRLYGRHADEFLSSFDMLRGDDLTLPKDFGDNGLVKWLTLNYNAETDKVRDSWQYSYEAIYRANWIIANVTDNPDISAEAAKSALAEAHFIRGFAYFNLTRLFEEVPIVLEPTSLDDLYPEKSTNEECWAQVISDFEASLNGLPAPKANFVDGRANTGVANGMLARAYLYRTRPGSTDFWDKVKEHTQAVENLAVYALEPIEDFSVNFVYTKEDQWVENTEVLWAAGFIYGPIYGGLPFLYTGNNLSNLGSQSIMPVGRSTVLVVNENDDPYLTGNGRPGNARYAASLELSDIMLSYNELGDQRAEEFLMYPSYNDYALEDSNVPTSVIVKEVVNADSLYREARASNGSSGEYLHIKKFVIREFIGTNIWDGGYNHPLMYPILRYADVLLMRAEAEYHLGNEGLAQAYLKQVTDRAGFAPDYVNAFAGEALNQEILQQRRVELFFESLRVPDLIRTEQFNPQNVGTYPGSVAWDEKLTVVPIPRRELDQNPKLVQHPLWR